MPFKTRIKAISKIVLILISILMIVLISSILLISTGVLNEPLRKLIVSEANKVLAGQISIESIDGNILSDFEIKNITITQDDDTILKAKSLDVDYQILKLFAKTIEVESVRLERFKLNASEYEKDKWNLLDIVPASDDSSETAPFNWKVNIGQIWIDHLQADIDPFDENSTIPKKAKLNAFLGMKYWNDEITVVSDSLQLTTQDPSVAVKNLAFHSTIRSEDIQWQDFILKLDNSLVQTEGSMSLTNPLNSNFSFLANPLDLSDLKPWIGNVSGKPQIDIDMTSRDSDSDIKLLITEENQSVKLNGIITEINDLPSYNVNLIVDSFNGEHWTNDPSMRSLIMGELDLKGKGLDIKHNSFELVGAFGDVQYGNYTLDDLLISLSKDKENANGQLKLNSVIAKAETEFQLENIFNKPLYNGTLSLANLNLAKVLLDEKLVSDINLILAFSGKGFNIGRDEINLKVSSSPSSIARQKIDKLNASVHIDSTIYSIDNLDLISAFADVKIKGYGDMLNRNFVSYSVNVKQIEKLTTALDIPQMEVNAIIAGNISGPAHRLKLNTLVDIKKIVMDSLHLSNGEFDIGTELSLYDYEKKEFTEVNFEKLVLKVDGKIQQIRFEQYYAQNLDLRADKIGQSAKGSLDMQSSLGEIASVFKVDKLFQTPEFNTSIDINKLDLSEILQNDSIDSNINLQVISSGRGKNLSDLLLKLDVISKGSSIDRYEIGDFNAKLNYNKGLYELTGLSIESPMANVRASGSGHWPMRNNLDFQIKVEDSEKLASAFDLGNTNIEGSLDGKILGSADSLGLQAKLNLHDMKIDTLQIGSAIANIDLAMIEEKPFGNILLSINEVKLNESGLESFNIQNRIENKKVYSTVSFSNPQTLSGNIETIATLGKKKQLWIPSISVKLADRYWQGGSDSARISLNTDSIRISGFSISSSESKISAGGYYTSGGGQDLKIQIQNIRLESIPGIALLPYEAKGNLSTDLYLVGEADDPVLDLDFRIDQLQIDTFMIGNLSSIVGYRQEIFLAEVYLKNSAKEIINSKISIPGKLSLKESQFDIYEDESMSAMIRMDEFDSKKISRFIDLDGISYQGLLSVKVDAKNTLNDPLIDGNITFKSGRLNYPEYGINYRDITLNSKIDNSNYYLENLSINSGRGKLDLKGTMEIQSWLEGEIKTFDFSAIANNFMLLNNQGMNAYIDSDLMLKGNIEKPEITGDVTIVRSMINTDILAQEYGGVSDESQEPLLIRAKREQSMQENEFFRDTIRTAPPAILNNIKAEVKIDIPRNTWVKGKNMNFELSGSVKVLQDGEQVDLFGEVNVKRGFYKLYGKKLDFEEGVITFTGGKITNPLLNFSVAYKFRDDQQRMRKLIIKVQGRLEQPQMLYAIDGVDITEKEAISYLLFKKGANELNNDENASVQGSNLEMAKSMAINQITGAVQDKLQSALRLDAIEISGENNWKQAKASIGKYITNNLYLSYEQSFALNKKDKAINPYKVGLEYQILPWLYFQGTNQSSNSGFDLIMKWSWR